MTEAGTGLADKHWKDYGVYPMHFAVVDSLEDFRLVLDSLGVPHEDAEITKGFATTYEFINDKTNRLAVIVLLSNRLSWNPYSMAGVAAHEALHCVQALWRHIGEKNPGDEAEAYLLQNIVDEIMTVIKDNHPYKKKPARKIKADPVNLTQA
jgi:hypothetical protein